MVKVYCVFHIHLLYLFYKIQYHLDTQISKEISKSENVTRTLYTLPNTIATN